MHYLVLMDAVLEARSTLTVRNQTTVPPAVRQALKLGRRAKVRYLIQSNGTVIMARADSTTDKDPALDSFLQFLAKDITSNPQNIRPVGTKLARHIRSLTKGVKIDLDAPLTEDE